MAHIEIKGRPGGGQSLVINGIDFTGEAYRGIEIVEVGDDEAAEVGLRLTLAVGRLDLDADADVELTDHVPAIAARVRSMIEDVA